MGDGVAEFEGFGVEGGEGEGGEGGGEEVGGDGGGGGGHGVREGCSEVWSCLVFWRWWWVGLGLGGRGAGGLGMERGFRFVAVEVRACRLFRMEHVSRIGL